MWTEDSWQLSGFYGKAVPNEFYRKSKDNSRLAIVFPGYGYSTQAPLLYYAIELLSELGYDVLSVNYEYNKNEGFLKSPETVQDQWFAADVAAVLEMARSRPQYSKWVVVGKSLGTTAILQLLSEGDYPMRTKLIWLTPGFSHSRITEVVRTTKLDSIFFVGTLDRYYDQTEYELMKTNARVRVELFKGADHSLQTSDSTATSIEYLKRYLASLRSFISNS